jgi:hypothetical protein
MPIRSIVALSVLTGVSADARPLDAGLRDGRGNCLVGFRVPFVSRHWTNWLGKLGHYACPIRRRHARPAPVAQSPADPRRRPDMPASTPPAGGRVGARGRLGLTPGSPKSRGPG